MTSGDPVILRRKLAVIVENLKALQTIETLSPDQYQANIFIRKGTERLLQELIEAAIDINTHILVMEGHGAPPDYHQGFLRLADHGILSRDLAEALAPSAGLRNQLVHEYEKIL
jgi:uncharacterized protein YutE (UPF0331/DUF86 family)